MYSIPALAAAGLTLAVAATAAILVVGVLRWFPRSGQAVTAGVQCPLIGRRATAELARDEWTRRLVDVSGCSVLGSGVALCRRTCRLAVARTPRFSRS